MQPLIIFGTRNREEDKGSGDFFCPHCNEKRRYNRKRVRNYFSLYFVPLIPLGKGQEYVQCQFCSMAFQPEVLDMTIKPKRKIRPLAEQLNTLKDRLESGVPVEYVIADLTAAGLDRDLANENVNRMIGEVRRICPTCNLTYAGNVMTCAEDGTALVDA
jgi:hypothetical protein